MKQLVAYIDEKKRILEANESETILSVLARNNISMTAPCGGQGRCGKCKVKVMHTFEDKERMCDPQTVLACQTYVTEDMEIDLSDETSFMDKNDPYEMSTVTDFYPLQTEASENYSLVDGTEINAYGIAIDLGTTTVAAQLIDLHTGICVATETCLNPQSVYGADVISRIKAASEGHAEDLRQKITMCIKNMIFSLVEKSRNMAYAKSQTAMVHQELQKIRHIVIAGNTTMLHLLSGYPVEQLGKYPFTPYQMDLELITVQKLLETVLDTQEFPTISDVIEADCPVTILPGVSAFVGADIVSGLYGLELYKKEGISLFLDLGTNGEIAIGNRTRIIVSATAAGPAFEGSMLSCGTGSVAGAIQGVEFKKNYIKVRTIDNKPPIGLCGTGAIEVLAELLRTGTMDKSGLLREEYHEQGFVICNTMKEDGKIVLTQNDIRQLQMAKAAIRSGLAELMKAYGAEYQEIEHFYIAGGMGFTLDLKKAARIGLIPEELVDRTVIVGNSSMGGAVKYLKEEGRFEVEMLTSFCKPINLAEENSFQETFMQELDF